MVRSISALCRWLGLTMTTKPASNRATHSAAARLRCSCRIGGNTAAGATGSGSQQLACHLSGVIPQSFAKTTGSKARAQVEGHHHAASSRLSAAMSARLVLDRVQHACNGRAASGKGLSAFTQLNAHADVLRLDQQLLIVVWPLERLPTSRAVMSDWCATGPQPGPACCRRRLFATSSLRIAGRAD